MYFSTFSLSVLNIASDFLTLFTRYEELDEVGESETK